MSISRLTLSISLRLAPRRMEYDLQSTSVRLPMLLLCILYTLVYNPEPNKERLSKIYRKRFLTFQSVLSSFSTSTQT